MTATELLAFLRGQKWAVQASVSPEGSPQAAVIGVAVSEAFEFVFDTLVSSRKAVNLRAHGSISLVVGWDEAQTAQVDGIADEPVGEELERLKELYFARFPDGRDRARDPEITYFRVRPTWVRYSDFRGAEPSIVSFTTETLKV